jgi:peptidoglycan/LPS O-acetylase OafA/YrhL
VAQYFGRISYGLYLYHMFMKYIGSMLENKFGRFGFHMPKDEVAQFFVLLVMSIVAAAASEILLERPINRLKRLFPTEPVKEGAKA